MVLEALGFTSASGRSDSNLEIEAETEQDVFQKLLIPKEVFFNPNEITIDKSVVWASKAKQGADGQDSQFTHGLSRTLSMELIFDTYELGESVTTYTSLISGLATVKDFGESIHRPPRCKLHWGSAWGMTTDGEFFLGVLENISQRFTLFLFDGTPVRATLFCRFKEWSPTDKGKRSSSDVAKTRTVQRGDTLSSIANEEYHDPAMWRHIAERNEIDNPRLIKPGQTLLIPAIRPQNKSRR